MDEGFVMVRLTPMDKEWANRALRAVLSYDLNEGYGAAAQRYFELIPGKVRGYTCAMTTDDADALANLVYAGRKGGGPHWEEQVTKVAGKFRSERFPAKQAVTTGRWVPEAMTKRPPSTTKGKSRNEEG